MTRCNDGFDFNKCSSSTSSSSLSSSPRLSLDDEDGSMLLGSVFLGSSSMLGWAIHFLDLKNFENLAPAIGGWCRIALNFDEGMDDDECLIFETEEDFFIDAADVFDVELAVVVVLDAIDDVLVDANRLRYVLVSGAMGVIEGSLLSEMRREEIVFLGGTITPPVFVLLLLDLLVKHDFVGILSVVFVVVVTVDLLELPAPKRLRYLLKNLFDF